MCKDILPEVEDCCVCIPLRIGMIYISILAIMSGSLSLSMIEKNSDLVHYAIPVPTTVITGNYSARPINLFYVSKEYYIHYNTEDPAKRQLSAIDKTHMLLIILAVLCYMSIFWIVLGVVLLISALLGEQCLVYVFIVGMFLLVLLGFLLIGAASYECLSSPRNEVWRCIQEDYPCIVRSMDWLTGSACILFFVIYLFSWIYFIIVANSFALNGDTV